MKKLSSISFPLTFSIIIFAKCREQFAAALLFSFMQINSYKYIGYNGKENKTNTKVMYDKVMKYMSHLISFLSIQKAYRANGWLG